MEAKKIPAKIFKAQTKKIKPNTSLDAFMKPGSQELAAENGRVKQAQEENHIAESFYIHEPTNKDIGPSSKAQWLITHWNVNSLNARLNNQHFKNYFESKSFDVICFNETKLTGKKFRDLKVSEHPYWFQKYYQYWSFSTKKLGYSGVCILSKIKPLSASFGISKQKFDIEGRVVTLEFDNFYLISVYVPNSGSQLDRLEERTTEWDVHFQEYVKGLLQKKGVVVMGDLNVAHENKDVANWKTAAKYAGFTDQERKSFAELLSMGMKDVFRVKYPEKVAYTYWDQRSSARQKNLGWRIDYCLVDEKTLPKVVDVEILENVFGSDHCPVEVILSDKPAHE